MRRRDVRQVLRPPRGAAAVPWWRAGAVAACLGFAGLHRLGSTWGSTPEERERPMPGDEIVPDPAGRTMHAITVDAAPDQVWPWLAQMGYHRAGWYTYPWVDRWIWHIENPSADRVVPALQDLRVGDVIPDGEPGTAYFVIRELVPGEHLVLHSTTHVPPALERAMTVSWTWSFLLLPVDGGRRTRLLLRVRLTGSLVTRLLWHLVVVPSDFVMARSMLLGVKRRAEGVRTGRWPGSAGP